MENSRLEELYGKKVEERRKPIELSFGDIDMIVPGHVDIDAWNKETLDDRKKLAKKGNLELVAAKIICKWAEDEAIREMGEFDVSEWIKEHFTDDDIIETLMWWNEITGVANEKAMRIAGEFRGR